jgi:hypothetical protein
MKPGEVVRVTAKRMLVGAILALSASWLAAACDSNGGGSTCFPPEHGPADTSCAGFDVTLTCPVSLGPYYTCTCTLSGSAQNWVCSPAGSGGGGGGSGGAGTGGSAGTGGADAGS